MNEHLEHYKESMLICADLHLKRWDLGGDWELGGDLMNPRPTHSRITRTLQMMTSAVKQANDKGCRTLVVNGDLLDQGKTIDPYILDALLHWLEWLRDLGWHVVLIVGNHERTSKTHNMHTLVGFNSLDHVLIVDTVKTVYLADRELLMMPFEYDATVTRDNIEEYFSEYMVAPGKKPPILVTHHPVTEACDATGRHFNCPLSVNDLQHEMFSHVFLGDIHKQQTIKGNVYYTGAPVPQTFSDLHNNGHFVYFNFVTDEMINIKVEDPNPLCETADKEEYKRMREEGKLVRFTGSNETITTGIKQKATSVNKSMPDVIRSYTDKACDASIREEVRKHLTEDICGQDVSIWGPVGR